MRPWREIAQELAREVDQKRVGELAEELNRAMEEQQTSGSPHVQPVTSPNPPTTA